MMNHRRNDIAIAPHVEATMDQSPDLIVRPIPVHSVTVPAERLRPMDEDKVQELAESMADHGLIQPIVVDTRHRLIAGRHRLQAAKRLEWRTIPARIIDVDHTPHLAELIELDENLVRNDLSVLERAQHLLRRSELLAEMGLRASRGRPKMGHGDPFSPEDPTSPTTITTTPDLAASIGVSDSTAKRYLRIARGLAPDVARAILGTDLANATTQLLELARLGPYSQRIALSLLRDGRADTVQEAIRILDGVGLATEAQEGELEIVLPSETGKSRANNPVLGKCRRCGRPLRDPASAAAGVGPTCACADTGHDVTAAGTGQDDQQEEETRSSMDVHYSSNTPEWYTPPEILAAVVDVMGAIDLDPCSNPGEPVVPARAHFTAQEDGLAQEWSGRVFMNPPYGRAIGAWCEKLMAEYQAGRVTEAIALVPARTDTAWFRVFRDCLVCFVAGRLRFHGPDGQGHPAPFPSAIVYMGPHAHEFVDRFYDIGDIWARV